MKSRNFIAHSTLSVCLVLVIITLGLTLASCDTGAGRAPAYNITFHQGEGEGRTPDRIPVAQNGYARLPEQGSMTHPAGKKLSGWKAPDDSLIYNPLMEYKVTKDVMFIAQWREASATLYTISFATGGGGGVPPASIQAVSGNVVSLPTQGNMSPPAGKVFDGWLANGIHYQERAQYRVTSGNVTITAQWKDAGSSTPNTPSTPTTTYTITYNANGGSGTAPGAQTANSGSSITLPSGSGLSRSGYTFGGWNTNASGTGTTYPAGSSYTVTGNATLYAKWDSNTPSNPTTPSGTTYTVTFNINGGSGTAPSAQTVNAGGSITLPSGSGLSRSGYTFGGWSFYPSGMGIIYTAGSSFTPTSDDTFYAKWDSSTTTPSGTSYTVTFVANGGSGTPPSAQTVTAGSIITLPGPGNMSRSGSTFGGWNTNASGTGTTYPAGSSYTVNGNINLLAKWIITSSTLYTVDFNANGGSGTAPSAQTVDSGSTIALPNGDGLSRSGYVFGGWNTSSSGMGTNYSAGSSYTVNGNITFYAKWNDPTIPVTTYTVSYNHNGGSGAIYNPHPVVNAGSSITLTGGAGLSRSGYTFGGWNTNASGTGTTYPAGSYYTVNGNITFYAKWDSNNTTTTPSVTSYIVTFNANGGSGSPPYSSRTANAGSNITLPDSGTLSRTGYAFGGWNTNVDGTGTTYPAGSSYTVTGNATLYAKWNPATPVTTYTITYNTNGGNGMTPSAQTVNAGSLIMLQSGSGLSRSGYTFGGWNTNSSGTGTTYPADSLYPVSGNITLYAKWNPL
jgi:uncharacterized repeat protein (TIGR02543 family)